MTFLQPKPTVAEFFAGIGLVRVALEREGFAVVWANDISPTKAALYAANFGVAELTLADVRNVRGTALPSVDVATASFPCTDLSVAGQRAGLAGAQSGLFWQFVRVLREMPRRPWSVLLENVPGFASVRGGEDLRVAIAALNALGYWCDLFTIDARRFVPQSRPRLFVVGLRTPLSLPSDWTPSPVRPGWIRAFVARNPRLKLQALPLDSPAAPAVSLGEIVERLPIDDPRWWPAEAFGRFVGSLSPVHLARLDELRSRPGRDWRTASRRTRQSVPVWEIRADAIAGCLRAARGGSSRQAVVEAGDGQARIRWMTIREYAALQGAPEYRVDGVPATAAFSGFGDAVCVPVIAWIARVYLFPAVTGDLPTRPPMAA